ncbi:MAG: zinc-ribbon domain containing protein [Verrucomicrobiales bacterium]|nr:zinc-ribbon domain containing protein [Verrucomicrobiales bacterium]
MDIFGETDPEKMPAWFFSNANFVEYGTAEKADWKAQKFTVAPRHWYIDAEYECPVCKRLFIWAAQEQKLWFEEYKIYVDAEPQSCRECRNVHKESQTLRKEYDEIISDAENGDRQKRVRVVEIIELLKKYVAPIPEGMIRKQEWFEKSLREP